jgi:hypothetical protein
MIPIPKLPSHMSPLGMGVVPRPDIPAKLAYTVVVFRPVTLCLSPQPRRLTFAGNVAGVREEAEN